MATKIQITINHKADSLQEAIGINYEELVNKKIKLGMKMSAIDLGLTPEENSSEKKSHLIEEIQNSFSTEEILFLAYETMEDFSQNISRQRMLKFISKS